MMTSRDFLFVCNNSQKCSKSPSLILVKDVQWFTFDDLLGWSSRGANGHVLVFALCHFGLTKAINATAKSHEKPKIPDFENDPIKKMLPKFPTLFLTEFYRVVRRYCNENRKTCSNIYHPVVHVTRNSCNFTVIV